MMTMTMTNVSVCLSCRRYCLSFLLTYATLLVTTGSMSTMTTAQDICTNDSDCANGGQCKAEMVDPETEYWCFCQPGYHGLHCEDTCPIQCQNGGQCQLVADDHGGLEDLKEYECMCPTGYSGSLCENQSGAGDEAAANCPLQCQNGGQCQVAADDHGGLDDLKEYECDCPNGFTGSLCQTSVSDVDVDSSRPASASTGGGSSNDNKAGVVIGSIAGALVVLVCILLIANQKRKSSSGGGGRLVGRRSQKEVVTPDTQDTAELPGPSAQMA